MGKKITVLYGTETGNSESLADEFAKAAKAKGHDVELAAASQKNINDLKSIENCVVVISTWGDGDAPADAEKFCETLYTAEEDEVK